MVRTSEIKLNRLNSAMNLKNLKKSLFRPIGTRTLRFGHRVCSYLFHLSLLLSCWLICSYMFHLSLRGSSLVVYCSVLIFLISLSLSSLVVYCSVLIYFISLLLLLTILFSRVSSLSFCCTAVAVCVVFFCLQVAYYCLYFIYCYTLLNIPGCRLTEFIP